MSEAPLTPPRESGQYRVLARKYRPVNFAELIGQQAMVRTLTNAILSGRLAHAFILTGVRGVGKTTTARIIARALNCVGPDGTGGPTSEPCGLCGHCRDIAEDRHPDVIEMDAASRTGVDDIRELIEGVRYRPTSAHYKVYIIDEVHMLSKNAFNALLKTLEEPPEHVKFIFATTEIRKVPVTVLSRCQRFDLRRVDSETLAAHFAAVAEKEGAKISGGAIALIARAADGSVRDGLSLLDQAIAHTGGEADEKQVRAMLGLADRSQTFLMIEAVFKGEVAKALELLSQQYTAGADPAQVLEDMLELSHWLTRVKVTPQAADDLAIPEMERVRGKEMALGLSMAALARAWQMLLKGLAETRNAPSPLQAAEMILVRLAYSSDLPTPEEAIKALKKGGDAPAASAPAPAPASSSSGVADPVSFDEVVALTEKKGEMILHANLISNVHLVSFCPGRIEFSPTEHADSSLAHRLCAFLNDNTARRWMVSVSNQPGDATMHQQGEAAVARTKADAAEHPLVRKIMQTFPGAVINQVREIDGGGN